MVVPVAHFAQAVAPAVEMYPASQSVQVVAVLLILYLPASQTRSTIVTYYFSNLKHLLVMEKKLRQIFAIHFTDTTSRIIHEITQ